MERFKAQVQKERVERALGGPEIAQKLGAGFDNVGSAAKFFSVRSICVLRIGIDEIRELSIIPVVIAICIILGIVIGIFFSSHAS